MVRSLKITHIYPVSESSVQIVLGEHGEWLMVVPKEEACEFSEGQTVTVSTFVAPDEVEPSFISGGRRIILPDDEFGVASPRKPRRNLL